MQRQRYSLSGLGSFGSDPQMLAVGSSYLRIALYFASQGAGELRWPIVAALVRVVIAVIGGWLAVRYSGRIDFLFFSIAAALAVFGSLNTIAVASGAWLPKRTAKPLMPQALGKAA